MRAFCAQAITVRGDITVERSPFMKAVRLRSATVTIWLIVLRPASVLYCGFFDRTIATSASWLR